jgi:hypothetical protein
MFEVVGYGPPVEWEPIPDGVLDELGPWPDDDLPAGLAPFSSGSDDLVWQALSVALGASTLSLLTATPFDAVSDQGRSLALRRIDELSAHLEAIKSELTSAITGPAPASARDRRDDFSPHEVSVATRCSVYAADAKIAMSRDLASRLTATLEAMHRGEITWQQARALSESTCHLDVDIAREIESKMLVYSTVRTRASPPARALPGKNASSSTPRAVTAPASCSCAVRWRSPRRSQWH